MTRIRQNLLPLYLVCALVTFGHARNDAHTAFKAEGHAPADSAFLAGFAGVLMAAAWPAYVSLKVWRVSNVLR